MIFQIRNAGVLFLTVFLFASCTANKNAVKAHRHHHLDPAHPPIDCPLRKQGINPHDLKPFDEIDKYIAFLEREDRELWQKPDKVIEALNLSGTETIVDLGAGSGYFAFRLAAFLPKGKVMALDIEPEMIRHIHHRAMTEGILNIQSKIINPDNPSISTEADIVFICDVLHHVQNRTEWLSKMFVQMKSGARLVLIEFKEGALPQGPPESLKISKDNMCVSQELR